MARKIFLHFLCLSFFLEGSLVCGSPTKAETEADEFVFKRPAVPVRRGEFEEIFLEGIETEEDWVKLARDITEFSQRALLLERKFPIFSLGDEFNLLDGPDFLAPFRELATDQMTTPDLFCEEEMPSSLL
ncbi:MAG: hypothetical protein ACRCUQ_00430 [Alphaproteobacteria bacterium]